MMYELEKSDSLVVPRKSANKAGLLAAEPMEGSGGIARNANLQRTARTQSRTRRVTRADRHTCGCGCIGCASSTRDRSPYAGIPLVRICAGGAQQWASLPQK